MLLNNWAVRVLVLGLLMSACAGEGDDAPGENTDVADNTDAVDGLDTGTPTEDTTAPGDTAVGEDATEDVLDDEPDIIAAIDTDEPPVYTPENIVINEVVVKAVDSGPDWIEIKNMEGLTVDLSGWGIRDHLNAHEYLFPEGTTVAAFGYKVVWGKGADFEFTMDFAFGVDKEARLFAPDGTLIDETDWQEGDAPAGTSWGRYPDGVGPFMMLDLITQGQPNQGPSD